MRGTMTLHIRNVSKTYPNGVQAVKNVTLTIPTGIRSGKQTIRITVPQTPARAGIDPSRKLIEREREDNVVEVKAQNGAAS
jgi:hypothetical protein